MARSVRQSVKSANRRLISEPSIPSVLRRLKLRCGAGVVYLIRVVYTLEDPEYKHRPPSKGATISCVGNNGGGAFLSRRQLRSPRPGRAIEEARWNPLALSGPMWRVSVPP